MGVRHEPVRARLWEGFLKVIVGEYVLPREVKLRANDRFRILLRGLGTWRVRRRTEICYIFVLSVRLAVVTCASGIIGTCFKQLYANANLSLWILFNGGCKFQLVDITEPPQFSCDPHKMLRRHRLLRTEMVIWLANCGESCL